MSDLDSPRIATVMLSEREVRALRLVLDFATNHNASLLIGTALPHAGAAVDKLAAQFLPRN